ncbi:hypothetical protein HK097_002741 [Rhizophlyctis rosea]|uniref:Uncharacterized protein n=1 Tax=Rhizophlyctis rosea TaxID=64517 RepID=A0AAD5S522_9FUNG|nr:hypothetical protein HK097_002741 [Rhizophlyctis rosea]
MSKKLIGHFQPPASSNTKGLSGVVPEGGKSPREYLPQPDIVQPTHYTTPKPKVSKATQFATDFFRLKQKMELEDEYQEALQRQIRGTTARKAHIVQKVEVVNWPSAKQIVTSDLNVSPGIPQLSGAGGGPNGSRFNKKHPRRGGGPPNFPPGGPPGTKRKAKDDGFRPYKRHNTNYFPLPPEMKVEVKPERGGSPVVSLNPLNSQFTISDVNTIKRDGEQMTSPSSGGPQPKIEVPDVLYQNAAREHLSNVETAPSELARSRNKGKGKVETTDVKVESPAASPANESFHDPNYRPDYSMYYKPYPGSSSSKTYEPLTAHGAQFLYNVPVQKKQPPKKEPEPANPLEGPQIVNHPSTVPHVTVASGSGIRPHVVVPPLERKRGEEQGVDAIKRLKTSHDYSVRPRTLGETSSKVYQKLRKEYSKLRPVIWDPHVPTMPADDLNFLNWKVLDPEPRRDAPKMGTKRKAEDGLEDRTERRKLEAPSVLGKRPAGTFEYGDVPPRPKHAKVYGRRLAGTFIGVDLPERTILTFDELAAPVSSRTQSKTKKNKGKK